MVPEKNLNTFNSQTEKNPEESPEKEIDLEKIFEKVKENRESQEEKGAYFKERTENNAELIKISHQVVNYFLGLQEKDVENFWQNLENKSFSSQNQEITEDLRIEFLKFKSWILSTVVIIKTLKELGLTVRLAPTELDLKYGIDIIGQQKERIWGIQLKAQDLATLKTNKVKIQDLISRPTGKYKTIMSKGLEKLKEMCDKRDKKIPRSIKSLMITIPTGKEILKDNGDFGKRFNKKGFINALNNSIVF